MEDWRWKDKRSNDIYSHIYEVWIRQKRDVKKNNK